jgi:hypothetical protein
MTRDIFSYSTVFFGGIWYGKKSKESIKKNESLSKNDSKNTVEFDDYEIIDNTFKGPGSIDKIFEWHSKNKSAF